MEPVSIAVAVATLLAKRAAEGVGTALGDAVRSGIAQIYEAVRAKFAGDVELDSSIERLEAKPESPARAAELAENLEARLARDPDFAADLEKLINGIPDDDKDGGASFIATVKDNARVGKITNIGEVRGDVHF